jgi:simple sugar transport system ATP-binding protein
LQWKHGARGGIHHLSFAVHPGEIVGIAGVEGNGQQELIECLCNVNRRYGGKVLFRGQPLSERETYEARQAGLALIPPDRHREGLVLDFTVSENYLLGHHREPRYGRHGWFSSERIGREVAEGITRFDVRPPDPTLPVSALSGGNQQKVIIGRELSQTGDNRVRLLIAAHPTRGVDVGAIEFIHSQCLQLRDEGAGELLITSELDEILALADRILVLFEGRFTGEVKREAATERELGLWMTGAHS